MMVVEFSSGDIAWLEPESDADRKLIELAKENGWTIDEVLGELNRRPLQA
jgi:hypothetical protein